MINLKRYILVLIVSLIQVILLLVFTEVLTFLFNHVKPNIAWGVTMYYFRIFGTLLLLISNIIFCLNKKILNIISFLLSIAFCLFYFENSYDYYPNRTLYISMCFLVINTIGYFLLKHLKSNNKKNEASNK